MFVLGTPVYCFMGKARSLSYVRETEMCLPNIGSGLICKHLTRFPGTNAVTYYEDS